MENVKTTLDQYLMNNSIDDFMIDNKKFNFLDCIYEYNFDGNKSFLNQEVKTIKGKPYATLTMGFIKEI